MSVPYPVSDFFPIDVSMLLPDWGHVSHNFMGEYIKFCISRPPYSDCTIYRIQCGWWNTVPCLSSGELSSFTMYLRSTRSTRQSCVHVFIPFPSQECSGKGRRMAMDGNMNLVRRIEAGKSSRSPLHSGRFFLPQDEVDAFTTGENDEKLSDGQVWKISIQFCYHWLEAIAISVYASCWCIEHNRYHGSISF